MPHDVFYDSVESNKVVEPVVQSTQLDSDSEIESEPQEAVAPRKSKGSTKGAHSSRYELVVTHKLVCPTISWFWKIVDPLQIIH